MDTTKFVGHLDIQGNLTVRGTVPSVLRSTLQQEDLAKYPVPWTSWRVFDAFQTNTPGTPASDDLGITGGTWGTNSPKLTTGDVKTTSPTMYARAVVSLPPEYVEGETVVLRIHAGMLTTVADTSANLDVEAYIMDREGLVSGSDICATAAQSINSLTFADKDFTLTATNLDPGDQIDIRVKIAVVDGATGTAVEAAIGSVELLCDIKG